MGLCFRVALGMAHQHTDPPHPLRLLRARRKRPRRRRAAKELDELAPPDHSITSSARASSVGGISIPSALAVLRLEQVEFGGILDGQFGRLVPLENSTDVDAALAKGFHFARAVAH
jgi:hypothetical protein